MRDDLLHDSSLEDRIAPLLAAAAPADVPWLRSLLTDRETLKAFSALDSELFVRGDAGAVAIAVASAGRSEGRTTYALMLAVLTAVLDPSKRVVLIDADNEQGRLGEMLGISGEAAGLAQLFAAKVPVAEAVHATALPNLFVVPQGRGGARALAFAPQPFTAMLSELRNRFDLLIVDTPSGGSSMAVLSIAKIVGLALLVVRYSGPTREQVASFLANLNRAGAEVMGCVMNRREYVVPAVMYGNR